MATLLPVAGFLSQNTPADGNKVFFHSLSVGLALGSNNNWIMPCPLRDHHHVIRGLIDRYRPEPEDEMAAQALIDGNYYEGMMAYNEETHQVLDPLWEEAYLESVDEQVAICT